jgi:hypothetical protein
MDVPYSKKGNKRIIKEYIQYKETSSKREAHTLTK